MIPQEIKALAKQCGVTDDELEDLVLRLRLSLSGIRGAVAGEKLREAINKMQSNSMEGKE